jgi:hypothetical protein
VLTLYGEDLADLHAALLNAEVVRAMKRDRSLGAGDALGQERLESRLHIYRCSAPAESCLRSCAVLESRGLRSGQDAN